MAIREANLLGNPTEGSTLILDVLPELASCIEQRHRAEFLRDTSIVPADTLRNYILNMNTKSVPERTFGEWLGLQLDRREWSGADLARRLGVANGNVSRWLRDERKPSSATVDRIADVLGIDVDIALTYAGHRPSGALQIDPDGPTARLRPLIEKVNWSAYPGRLETLENELQFMIETDRKNREKRKG